MGAGSEVKKKRPKHLLCISSKFLTRVRLFKRRKISCSLTLLPLQDLSTESFTVKEVKAIIKNLNLKKMPDYVLITNQILQKVAEMANKMHHSTM